MEAAEAAERGEREEEGRVGEEEVAEEVVVAGGGGPVSWGGEPILVARALPVQR